MQNDDQVWHVRARDPLSPKGPTDIWVHSEFEQAKQRISNMDVKIIEEKDPLRQCLLQIYAALAAGAK